MTRLACRSPALSAAAIPMRKVSVASIGCRDPVELARAVGKPRYTLDQAQGSV